MIEYLFGDDTFTARKKIHERSRSLPATLHWIDAENTKNESVEELFDLSRGSLLGNVLVVMQNPSSYSEEVRERILAKSNPEYQGNVILWDQVVDKRLTFYKKMKDLVASKEMKQPATDDDMAVWIMQQWPEMPKPAISELIARVGYDVWAAANEIDKLRVLPQPISVSQVAQFVAQRDTGYTTAFPLLDAIVRKQKALAVRICKEMIDDGASEHFILAMLAYQFRLFLGVRMGKDAHLSIADIHSKTGFHSIAIQKAMPVASRLSVAQISEVLSKVAATEKSLIASTMDAKAIVTMLIIGLCR